MVLLTAFLAVGTNNRVSWWRITIGGALAGGAICGMHYLGNASIDNYNCVYDTVNVIGSVIIAVVASIVALSLFFAFRAAWTNSWWKRGLTAVILAGAVSGMHWCASTGTQYKLVRLNDGTNQLSRNTTVIVVICLSVVAAALMAATAVYTTNVMRRYADKAQQVVLAAAIFDQTGRILVTPDGLLPSEKITDTYVEKTPNDHFSIAHPLFHWMFQASRNWLGMLSIINSMTNHLAHLRKGGRDARVRLIDAEGQLIDNYDVIFRELFCVAASNLADKMKELVTDMGILWDEILPTGAGLPPSRHLKLSRGSGVDGRTSPDMDSIAAEKGEGWKARHQEYGRGSLMFLVRRVDNSRDLERLQAAGYRFAEVNQVAGIIGSGMQIKTRNLSGKLNNMAAYSEGNNMLEPGVHLGFFGLRARVGGFGFDVLVRKGARNLIPSMPMPQDHLEAWQLDFLRQLDRLSVPALCQKLEAMRKLSPREMLFASQLYDTVEALRGWIDDPIFEEAIISYKAVQVPCRSSKVGTLSHCTMITMKMVIPIHVNVQSPKCEFVPLSFFKVHQLVYKDSPHHAAFAREVHREIIPIVSTAPSTSGSGADSKSRMGFRNFGRPKTASSYAVDADGNPIPTDFQRKLSTGSNHTGSTLKLWNGANHEVQSQDGMSDSFPVSSHPGTFGGIMMTQEIKVDVQQAGEGDGGAVGGSYLVRRPPGPSELGESAAGPSTADERMTVVSGGHKKGNISLSGTITLAGIEMRSIVDREEIHSGAAGGSAVIEGGRAGEVTTFVDELFTLCIDGR